jgi:predicted amidohydrolase
LKSKVSIIQFQPALCDPAESFGRLAPLLDQAVGSDLIVLPELSNSGYNFRDADQAFSCSETIDGSGPFQKFLISSSGKLGAFIVSGINEREGDYLYNSAILVNASGIIGKYRKMHLFMNEKDVFQKGNTGLPVFDIGKMKIGIMICFDYLFPEPWRIMAQKGADIICHPSNLLTENPHKCLPGIGLMNRIYIATANRIGVEGTLHFNGKSFFTEPSGGVPETASPDQPAVISMVIDTDISSNKMITPRNHVFDDRRPDLYI